MMNSGAGRALQSCLLIGHGVPLKSGCYLKEVGCLNRLVVAKGEGLGEGWSGRLGLADVCFYIYGMGKQQGPTV